MNTILRPLSRLLEGLKQFILGVKASMIENAVGSLELEYAELESVFLIMVMGSLAGLIPVPPAIAVDILPLLRDEIAFFEDRAYRGNDVIGDLFSAMGGEW
ncbi:hypothetical protein [Desulfurococcus mucosus]|uniref:Uncharacterized protein n=1 Tax=Desulfurococcus mucosus (strain ATCC 35584 / DSM 2162 / JCM 9187 / O7/1) TaxID=765177 RepID=E8R8U3_DESM0|nr:hypothetical protein [Desulfurococcus mucosus]ADV64919.1 hypothetical protein Desmu_0611 [Desulfurococcus mucosus DSM 2162]